MEAKDEAPQDEGPGEGASAGGLEAISDLLKHMMLDSTAVVVIQHQAPSDTSVLPELLARSSSYTVEAAQDGQEVRPNHVYVIPPNADLAILDERLHVIPLESVAGRRIHLTRSRGP